MAEISEVYHKNNFENLASLVQEVDSMKEAFVVLDEELNNNWESIKDKLFDVQSNLVVQINSESVKRQDNTRQLSNQLNDMKNYVDDNVANIQNSSQNDLEQARIASEKNTEKITEMEGVLENIANSVEDLQSDFNEKNQNQTMNVKNITSQQVMLEQISRVDSERTYTDLQNATELIKLNSDMLTETRDTQNEFNLSSANSIKGLETKMDGSLLKKVDEKCNRIFEKVKNEQNSIWQNCLGFTAGIDDEKLDFLKNDPNLKNNYAYAVGGQDIFELPNLNAINDEGGYNPEDQQNEEVDQDSAEIDQEDNNVEDSQGGDQVDEDIIDDSNQDEANNSDEQIENSNELVENSNDQDD